MSERVPGGARWTPVPDVFFSRYLPALEDAAAVKVALHVLWRIQRRPAGQPPAIRAAAVAADATLRRGLTSLGVAEESVDRRLEAAVDQLVADGWLLEVRQTAATRSERWLLVNTPEGRAAQARLASPGPGQGSATGAGATVVEADAVARPLPGAAAVRANIFVLYEENIGLVTPILAEELAEGAAVYPEDWIERAFRLAVENNARSWRYIRAILERWARDGVDDESHRRGAETGRERDQEDPYAAWVER